MYCMEYYQTSEFVYYLIWYNVISFPQIKIKLHQDGSNLNSMHGIHRNIEFFPAMQCCYKSENVTQMCFMALFARDVL